MKVRVRRRIRNGAFTSPYVVEYKTRWGLFWWESRDFVLKESAVKYAKALLEDQVINIT